MMLILQSRHGLYDEEYIKTTFHTTLKLRTNLLVHTYYKDRMTSETIERESLIPVSIIEELLALCKRDPDKVDEIITTFILFYDSPNTIKVNFEYFRDFNIIFEAHADFIKVTITDGTYCMIHFQSLLWLMQQLISCDTNEVIDFLYKCK